MIMDNGITLTMDKCLWKFDTDCVHKTDMFIQLLPMVMICSAGKWGNMRIFLS